MNAIKKLKPALDLYNFKGSALFGNSDCKSTFLFEERILLKNIFYDL